MDIQKTTDELLKILENQENISEYLEENADEMIKADLSEYLEGLLEKYNISKKEAIKRSKLDSIYGYQIFSGVRKNPSRDKLIQLIFGLGLELKDAQRLLKIVSEGELYSRNRRDSIIIFALKNKLSLQQCDDLLFEMKEKTIISE